MSDRTADLRALLDRLKHRWVGGEIDEATYDRMREKLLADLSPEERVALGITATPQPVTPASLPPVSGTPHPTPSATPIGPSGGQRGGLRTARASLSDLDLEPGSVLLGQWRLVRELGRGGFGAVFEAEELSLGERHAVKILDPAMVAKEDLLARFRREVSLMRKLVHPRIVRVYDYREDLGQNLALISMELVAHGSVKQLVTEAKRRGQPVPLPLALNVLGQILEALAGAHGQGVIHRDVTPGNVLLAGGSPEALLSDPERDPQVKLVDFGIAGLVERTELSAKSRVLGTAAYVAPEVLDPSVEVTPQADVYGAGAMGYELVTGRLPVGRFDEPMELRPELGRELNRYLLNLLSSRPESRPGAKVAAWGLRELREESAKRQVQAAAAQSREQEEARQRQLEQERQRREAETQKQEAALRERQAAERRAIEAARQAAAERQRQAEQARLTEEARRLREAPPTPAPVHPSIEVSGRKAPGRSGPSPAAWLGIVALVVAVVAGIGWGVSQQKETERQRAVAEQQRQAAVAEEQRKAQEALEAERRRQAQLLEQERQKAAAAATQAERERIAGEQEAARQAETERLAQAQREAASRARQQREAEQRAAAERTQQEQAAREAEARRQAQAQAANPAGLEWVRIPGGSFTMGCTSGDSECDRDENPAHRVTVRGFQMAATETMVSQYQACVAAGRCRALSGTQQAGSDHPVVSVDWNESKAYCEWAGGRLPSESEWEFAARGGREGWRYPWGTTFSQDRANGTGTGGRDRWSGTSPVKSFEANGFGLYDMSGNVWEWVEDVWHDSYNGAPSDGSAWTSGGNASRRVLRGGSWDYSPWNLRVSCRSDRSPGHRYVGIGFRCARTEIP